MALGIINKIRKIAVVLAVFSVLTAQPAVLAAVYGGGNYGSCTYGNGCSTTSPSSTPKTTTKKPAGSIILLNDYDEYFTATGKTLDLKAGQIVYFDLTVNGTTERHKITIVTVGTDYVTIALDSGQVTSTLNIGDSKQYDVNSDGDYDIQVTLNGITGSTANMNFKVFAAPTPAPAANPAVTAKPRSNLWLIIASAIVLFVGLLIFLILFIRRRRKNKLVQF